MVEVEALLNFRKPKYDKLGEFFAKTGPIMKNPIQTVRMFIDMDSLVAPLFDERHAEYFAAMTEGKELNVASNVIGTAGHFRHYFWSRFNVYTDIYMLYTDRPAKSKVEVDKEFKLQMYDKRFGRIPGWQAQSDYVLHNYDIARRVCEFLPNIHLINCGETDPECVPSILMEEIPVEGLTLNLVVSNHKAFTQYVNHFNTGLLTFKGDKTQFMGKKTVMQELQGNTKRKEYDFKASMLRFALAMSGDRKIGITSIPGYAIKKALDRIEFWWNEGLLSTEVTEIDVFLDRITASAKPLKKEHAEIVRRVDKLMSIRPNGGEAEKVRILNQIVNKYDPMGLRRVNQQYFNMCPMDFSFLLDGESY